MGPKKHETKIHPTQIFQPVQFFLKDLDWDEWKSDTVNVLGHSWKVVLRQTGDDVSIHLVYTGPDSSAELYKIAFELGSKSPVGKVKKGTLRFEVGKAIGFPKITTIAKLENMFAEDGKLCTFIGLTAYAPEVISLKKKVDKLTKERNSLHNSLQAISVKDEDAAALNMNLASQPEVVKAYEAFQTEMKFTIFELMEKHGEKQFHTIMNELSSRIELKVAKKNTERTKLILNALNLDEGATGAVSSALKRILRQTFEFDKDKMNADDEQQVKDIVAKSKLEGNLADFAKFVWNMTEYQAANSGLFVNWSAIGNEVKFNASKHKSIDRKIKVDEPCIIVMPMLTSSGDFSNYNHDDDDSDIDQDAEPPICKAVVAVKLNA